jgi:hypothetical protein
LCVVLLLILCELERGTAAQRAHRQVRKCVVCDLVLVYLGSLREVLQHNLGTQAGKQVCLVCGIVIVIVRA